MRILVVTDAWHPQINGVVQTLIALAKAAEPLGAKLEFLTPCDFRSVPLPGYREIRLAIPYPRAVAARIVEAQVDAVHIATEGPIGHVANAICRRHGIPFTTSFHTRFPDYIAARFPFPENWSRAWVWMWLRWFHASAATVMAATPALARELDEHGFRNIGLWSRGVDTTLFRPDARVALDLARPIFLSVGRLAVEKNLDAFLALDLPGSKLVIGDGPERERLECRYSNATFLGARHGEDLAALYASADVFVFPSLLDTFGLVLLEALASGLPVAAFPSAAPQNVIGDAPVAAFDPDLRAACLRALTLSRDPACRTACRSLACSRSWAESARTFLQHVASEHEAAA